jgi:phosphatidylinositol glycan class W
MTILSSSSHFLNIFIALLLMATVSPLESDAPDAPKKRLAKPPRPASVVDDKSDFTKPQDPFPTKPFVTAYRGTMMVITCAAILAVDFKVFPRRFAKTENWGVSLMDLGVGSFVFSAGVVAARPVLKQRLLGKSQGLVARLRTAMRHAIPLFVLGLVRLYTVKGLDYAEHVSEYGVHWNFFFTLAFVPPFVAVFDVIFSFLPSYSALAILLAGAYELVLDNTDLKKFVLTAPRVDLLSQNREGVFSFFGYLAIFLAGQGAGMYVLPRAADSTSILQNNILRMLGIWTAAWCVLFFVATNYRFGLNLQVSRRLANLPYVLWVAAFNTGQLFLFYLIEAANFPHDSKRSEASRADFATSRLLRAFNRNGLAIFLLANLLTGLVNMTMRTLDMSDQGALGVLMGYMAVLAGVAFELDRRGISVKL